MSSQTILLHPIGDIVSAGLRGDTSIDTMAGCDDDVFYVAYGNMAPQFFDHRYPYQSRIHIPGTMIILLACAVLGDYFHYSNKCGKKT